MMQFIKKIGCGTLKKIGLGGSIHLYEESALKQYGWFDSFRLKESIDADGNPIPWYTYAFKNFLEQRLRADFEVFEYGSGNSTRWFAQRVSRITAVEHDKAWIAEISAKLPDNASIISRSLGSSYIEAILQENKKFDIIVVDGRDRVKCALYAAGFLKPDGVLILDNSDRSWYQPIKDTLEDSGFKKLDFWGMGPITNSEFCSTIFYRKGNCLGI
jgi:hypothetical protein